MNMHGSVNEVDFIKSAFSFEFRCFYFGLHRIIVECYKFGFWSIGL